jgi:hypothetical protein
MTMGDKSEEGRKEQVWDKKSVLSIFSISDFGKRFDRMKQCHFS